MKGVERVNAYGGEHPPLNFYEDTIMATFITYVIIITILSAISAYKLGTENRERAELFLGAFVAFASLAAVIEAISYFVSLIAMTLFNFHPTIAMHLMLTVGWVYCLIAFLSFVFKQTK